jgi:UDP-glucose 4-epimerase
VWGVKHEVHAAPAVVVVTGATGFVCASLVVHLAQRGHRVLACDIEPPPLELDVAWRQYGEKVEYTAFDVSREESWSILDNARVQSVIHGAAVTPERNDPNPGRTARVNLGGTIAGLEYARRRPGVRFVYVSSSGIYGTIQARDPLRETRRVTPRDSYCLAKHAGEQFVSLYRGSYNVDACSVRLAAPYGPWDRPTAASNQRSPIYRLMIAAVSGRACYIDNPSVSRDWTYIEDVAAGLAHLATLSVLPHDLFNLSTGVPVSLRKIARIVSALVPQAKFSQHFEDNIDIIRSSEIRSPLDISRLKSTGFTPQIAVNEGIAKYLKWLQGEGAFVIPT